MIAISYITVKISDTFNLKQEYLTDENSYLKFSPLISQQIYTICCSRILFLDGTTTFYNEREIDKK